MFKKEKNDTMDFWMYDGSAGPNDTGRHSYYAEVPKPNEWTHLVRTLDGEVQLGYVNGVTQRDLGLQWNGPIKTVGEALYIGAENPVVAC
ncbi:LamG-like jellyroll fold domain-containing protein [Candidatus Poribacteria bacterium]